MKLTILVAIFFTYSANAGETIGKIIGQLGMAEGEVLVDNKQVKKNSALREGSVVEVKKGKATLLLGTGSVFHLSANSKMIVKQFGMRSDTNKEGGDVALSFGKTRALILNKGAETKDVRIQTRTATMGVRGTDVFVNAGDAGSFAPVEFFTLEGKAHVQLPNPEIPRIEVPQNTGVAAAGSSAGNGANGGGAGGGAGNNPPKTMPTTMSVSEVKNEIKGGMQVANMRTSNDMRRMNKEYSHNDGMNIPFFKFDPLVDSLTPISIIPHFCNAVGGGTCP